MQIKLINVFLVLPFLFNCSSQQSNKHNQTTYGSSQKDPFSGTYAGEESTVNNIRLCWCPEGNFIIGSPENEVEHRSFENQVEITISRGFWTAKYELTQGEWKMIEGDLPGKLTLELLGGDEYPVGNVNFEEAENYCKRLSDIAHQKEELPENWEFRLPTEAQWEYTCRAGTTTATSFGNMLDKSQANFRGKPYNNTNDTALTFNTCHKVGSYPANPWGIHDMHGNIYEWCRDWFHAKLPGGIDPDLHDSLATALMNGTGDYSRSRRGGAWVDDGWACRAAFRLRFEPNRKYDHIGFRVVLVRK